MKNIWKTSLKTPLKDGVILNQPEIKTKILTQTNENCWTKTLIPAPEKEEKKIYRIRLFY